MLWFSLLLTVLAIVLFIWLPGFLAKVEGRSKTQTRLWVAGVGVLMVLFSVALSPFTLLMIFVPFLIFPIAVTAWLSKIMEAQLGVPRIIQGLVMIVAGLAGTVSAFLSSNILGGNTMWLLMVAVISFITGFSTFTSATQSGQRISDWHIGSTKAGRLIVAIILVVFELIGIFLAVSAFSRQDWSGVLFAVSVFILPLLTLLFRKRDAGDRVDL